MEKHMQYVLETKTIPISSNLPIYNFQHICMLQLMEWSLINMLN